MKSPLVILALSTACVPALPDVDYTVEFHECTELQQAYLQRSKEILEATPEMNNLDGYPENELIVSQIINGIEGVDYRCARLSSDSVHGFYSFEKGYIVIADSAFKEFDDIDMNCALDAQFNWDLVQEAYAYEDFMSFFGYRGDEIAECMDAYESILEVQTHEYMHAQGEGEKYIHSKKLSNRIDHHIDVLNEFGEDSPEERQAYKKRMKLQKHDYVYSYDDAFKEEFAGIVDENYESGMTLSDDAFDTYLAFFHEWDDEPYDHYHDLITDARTERMSACYELADADQGACVSDVREWYAGQVAALEAYKETQERIHWLASILGVESIYFETVMGLYPNLSDEL